MSRRQQSRATAYRIGAVSYLNTKPLVYGLSDRLPGVELVFDVPSRLADQLAQGDLDVALIPSVEFFQNAAIPVPSSGIESGQKTNYEASDHLPASSSHCSGGESARYQIVSDACIGCRGPVLSVRLLTRVPWSEIRSVGLDEGSRTSIALTRILLKNRYGIDPRPIALPLGQPISECRADAVLLIGDRAIHPPQDAFIDNWDLGEQWCRWSGAPFVFAMWTARAATDLGPIPAALSAARDEGVAQIERIARQEAPSVALEERDCLHYLRDHLHFYLGAQERAGLELFYQHAARMGLAPRGVDLASVFNRSAFPATRSHSHDSLVASKDPLP